MCRALREETLRAPACIADDADGSLCHRRHYYNYKVTLMNEEGNTATPLSLWLVGGAALIWNLFGMVIYVMTVSATPDQLAQQYNDMEIAFMQSVPAWATSANAIAVTAGVIGSVLLLMRRKQALPVFIVSLLALLVQNLHSFVLTDVIGVFGMVPLYIAATVFVIAIALVFYSYRGKRSGLLR